MQYLNRSNEVPKNVLLPNCNITLCWFAPSSIPHARCPPLLTKVVLGCRAAPATEIWSLLPSLSSRYHELTRVPVSGCCCAEPRSVLLPWRQVAAAPSVPTFHRCRPPQVPSSRRRSRRSLVWCQHWAQHLHLLAIRRSY